MRGGAVPVEIGAWLHIGETGVVHGLHGKVRWARTRTSLTQARVEELHVPPESVEMVMGDTDLTPFDMGTFGSLTTPRMCRNSARGGGGARDALAIWRP